MGPHVVLHDFWPRVGIKENIQLVLSEGGCEHVLLAGLVEVLATPKNFGTTTGPSSSVE
jgi:hypothetical protein